MRYILIVLLVAIMNQGYTQAPYNTTGAFDKKLKQGNSNKTIGIVTGLTGISLLSVGTVMMFSETLDWRGDYDEKKANTGELLMIIGGGLTVVSIPFLISGRKQRRMATSFSMGEIPYVSPNAAGKISTPALFLSVNMDIGR